MAYKSRGEKKAYRAGLLTGLRRKKRTTGRRRLSKRSHSRILPFTTDKRGRINGYNPKYPHKEPDMFIEHAMMQNELFGDFDYDSKGRIKGSYIDGRFEPD